MGSSSKKYKEKETRKRRHKSMSPSEEPKEKRHRHHKKHHKEKRAKHKPQDYESEDARESPNNMKLKRGRASELDTKVKNRNDNECFVLDSDVVEVPVSQEVRERSPPVQKEESPEPETSSKNTESLSIEETNKLRAKLGLKPLEVSKSSSSRDDGKKKDDLGEFYHKPATNIAKKMQEEKIRAKLNEHKEKRMLEQKLSRVKTLGESDSEDDTANWIHKSRKMEKEKKEAAKMAKMLEELDAQFGIGDVIESEEKIRKNQQYTSKNLKGFKVEHDMDNFTEGKSVILTLKDKEVLDEEEDILVNVNIAENERYKKNNEVKKNKAVYNAYDDQEFDEFGNYKEKSLLSQYDEEIDGEKRESFRIGVDNAIEIKQAAIRSIREKLSTKRLESLTLPELSIASDFYNEQEMAKFKKPKKKVRKMRAKGKLLTADDLEATTVAPGLEGIGKRRSVKEESKYSIDDIPEVKIDPDNMKLEEDDDDFQAALHKARKLKQKEKVATDIIAAVNNIKSELQEEQAGVDSSNIILNATAEFCRTLGDIPTYGKAGNRDEIEEEFDFEKDIKDENEEEDDCYMVEEDGSKWNSVDPNAVVADADVKSEVPILDEEPDVGSGVAAALKLAMSKGYLDKEENNRPSNSRLAHLQAKHYSIEDKSYGEEGERGGRRERYAGPVQDFKEKETFRPNVKLEYIDDEGHVLNSKEAFRYLSHKFHGKGPGKNKIEKRLKKVTQEGLMKKMSSTDTPLGTLNMLQAKQKEMQSPYIVLSGSKHTHSTVISKQRR